MPRGQRQPGSNLTFACVVVPIIAYNIWLTIARHRRKEQVDAGMIDHQREKMISGSDRDSNRKYTDRSMEDSDVFSELSNHADDFRIAEWYNENAENQNPSLDDLLTQDNR